MDLSGKIALVTGGGRGIGRQIALTLAGYGATVIVNYNGSKEKAEETVKEIGENGGQAEALGLTDYFYADGVCLIEWAENIESVLPPHCKKVTIRKTEENRREITVE